MSEAYTVLYSSQAVEDLRNIYSYIAYDLQVPEIAQEQVNRIRNGIRALDYLPFRYPLVEWEPWHSIEMHHFPVDHFIVFYQIDPNANTVTVIRIFYSGRDVRYIVTVNNE